MHNVKFTTAIRLPKIVTLDICHDDDLEISTDEVNIVTYFHDECIYMYVCPIIGLAGEEIQHSLVFAIAQPTASSESEALKIHLRLCDLIKSGIFDLAKIEVVHEWDMGLVAGNRSYKTIEWWNIDVTNP